MQYDLIIIGGGPAGLTAGLYAARRNLKCLILSETSGGLMALAHWVENYPGVEPTSGLELAGRMREQAERFGCEFKAEKVIGLDLAGDEKKVMTKENRYSAKAVIISSGAHSRKLNVDGEEKFTGRGVSYCATCDGPLFRGKKVAVVGGSDCAVNVAVYLSEIASETYVIHRRDRLRAEEANQERLRKADVKIIWDSVIEKIEGDRFVKKAVLKNLKTGESTDLAIDGIFVECGEIPTTDFLKDAGVELDGRGFIKVNGNLETNVKGVFAAGIVTGSVSQVIVAAGEGAKAATTAYSFVKGSIEGANI